MAAVPTDEVGSGSSTDGDFSDQQNQCLSGEALAEWRSSEQLENGVPSTSPPYWDSDDEDGGPKPAELYGKYTWKIDNFSQINKRELRSNPFEVGGYKWYILIYPQGCDVCNHLSLFLCVANHDKLLPGWSHFAQFTIAVVNKDPKKSKYSDTLHRFWKKEHDWGWKKFMELSKVFDGFIDSDTLVIKAQVQVIRERADHPFRCLDCQYRRELIRVYLTNVEQICRKFVEERRNKLGKLIEDKFRWSSFCAFWLNMDYRSRHHMSQEKSDSILKVVVKHFFIEKEVASTLVMDSLYSGLKALEDPYKEKKTKSKYLESEDLFVPIIRMEKDMFVLADDVLLLLERATTEPLPPKDEKGSQNRNKDGSAVEEFNKDYIRWDERRLTELGRRTIEIFILSHIFSKIEVAYQEAVSLKKQEELIREEEAAWLAEAEKKSRRGLIDKEKKSKKKQGKQKRNVRKGKDRGKDDNSSCVVQVEIEQKDSITESKDLIVTNEDVTVEKSIATEDESDSLDCVTGDMTVEKCIDAEDVSDVSDSVYCAPERLATYSGDFSVDSVSSRADTLEAHAPAEAINSGVSSLSSKTERKSSAIVDDSLSTSSSDSVPSLSHVTNSSHYKNNSPSRGCRIHKLKQNIDSTHRFNEELPKEYSKDLEVEIVPNIATHSTVKYEEDASCFGGNLCSKDVDADFRSPSKETPSFATKKLSLKIAVGSPFIRKKLSPDRRPDQSHISVISTKSAEKATTLKANAHKPVTPVTFNTLKINALKSSTLNMSERISRVETEKLSMNPSAVTTDQLTTSPVRVVSSSRVVAVSTPSSSSVTGRSGHESCSFAIQSSYRNAITGGPVNASSAAYLSSGTYSQAAPVVSVPQFGCNRFVDINPSSSFGTMNHDSDQRNFDLNGIYNDRSPENAPSTAIPVRICSYQSSVSPEEFPHLDIINDLLDDENGSMNTSISDSDYYTSRNGHRHPPPTLTGYRYGFPGDTSSGSSTTVCRFERTRSFGDDRFHYRGTRTSLEARRDMIPSQWQVTGTVISSENAGYIYRSPEYRNASSTSIGSSGFPVYRPRNGL